MRVNRVSDAEWRGACWKYVHRSLLHNISPYMNYAVKTRTESIARVINISS